MEKEKVAQPAFEDPSLTEGLSREEALSRQKDGYGNKATVKVDKSYGKIILDNTVSIFSVVLFSIGLLFFVFSRVLIAQGEEGAEIARVYFGISKYGFLGPLLFSIIIGIVQEVRSKHVLDKLRLSVESKTRVIRDGKEETIPSDMLVLGDVVLLSAGEVTPADIEIKEGLCEVDESFLTGESEAVSKSVKSGNFTLYSGSSILSGSVKGIVRQVGVNTEINKLSKKVKKIQKSRSELMRNIYQILNFNSILLGVIILIVLGTLMAKISVDGMHPSIFASRIHPGQPLGGLDSMEAWSLIIVTTSAFAIGVIPTGLVLMTSIALAASVISLARQKTLIQELYSLENLSRVDVICLDKTGTLTDGSMQVEDAYFIASEEKATEAIRLLLGAFPERNQTSHALFLKYGEKHSLHALSLTPFSSARKYSAVKFEDGKEILLGAPEALLDKESDLYQKAQEKAEEGYRVLALSENSDPLALYFIKDGLRLSAKETIAYFVENSLSVKIISGDSPKTVSAIAKECGVPNADKAISLEGMGEEEVKSIAEDYAIYARVSPEQKEWLVEAMQKNGHKVAMTGDGVNDILALRKANASITFQKATDAAKSCADVVLLDNDFSHLKEVVGQGRKVVNNIMRTASLFLTKTICIASLAIWLIPFQQGQTYYTIEDIYLMQTSIIAVGGFLLSLEPSKKPIEGRFKTNVYLRALASGLFMLLASIIPPILSINGWMKEANVSSMISILEWLAGFIVLIVFCLPLNKYRTVSMILCFVVAVFLALAIPQAYVGGRPLSIQDFASNKVWHEAFQPWNSQVMRNLVEDPSCWITFVSFLLLGSPLFFFVHHFIRKAIVKIEAKDALTKKWK